METRAAVAHKAGQPLSIETVRLDGPKAGEVLVEIKATGICHTESPLYCRIAPRRSRRRWWTQAPTDSETFRFHSHIDPDQCLGPRLDKKTHTKRWKQKYLTDAQSFTDQKPLANTSTHSLRNISRTWKLLG